MFSPQSIETDYEAAIPRGRSHVDLNLFTTSLYTILVEKFFIRALRNCEEGEFGVFQ